MKRATTVFLFLVAGCGSSFVSSTIDGGGGNGEDASLGGDAATSTDAGSGADATTTSGDDAATGDDAASTGDDDGGTNGQKDAAADAGAWTSLPFPAAGSGGIAVANGQLYYASSAGVYSCALPACSSFTLTYPGLASSALTANATSAGGALAWLSGDAGTIDVTDPTGAKQAFASPAPAGTFALQIVYASDGVMYLAADTQSGTSYTFVGLGSAADPAENVADRIGSSFLRADSQTVGYAAGAFGGEPATVIVPITVIDNGGAPAWVTNSPYSVCPDGGVCTSIDALAARGTETAVYAAVTQGSTDSIVRVGANGVPTVIATGQPSPIDKMYKYANGLVWTSGTSLYGCTSATTSCVGGLIGTASAPFDAITSDDTSIYVEVPEAPGTIERFLVPHS